jgi:hypothetical protein
MSKSQSPKFQKPQLFFFGGIWHLKSIWNLICWVCNRFPLSSLPFHAPVSFSFSYIKNRGHSRKNQTPLRPFQQLQFIFIFELEAIHHPWGGFSAPGRKVLLSSQTSGDFPLSFDSPGIRKGERGKRDFFRKTREAPVGGSWDHILFWQAGKPFRPDLGLKVNSSTPRHQCRGLLRVDPERRFLHRSEGRSLAPPNGSRLDFTDTVKSSIDFFL